MDSRKETQQVASSSTAAPAEDNLEHQTTLNLLILCLVFSPEKSVKVRLYHDSWDGEPRSEIIGKLYTLTCKRPDLNKDNRDKWIRKFDEISGELSGFEVGRDGVLSQFFNMGPRTVRIYIPSQDRLKPIGVLLDKLETMKDLKDDLNRYVQHLRKLAEECLPAEMLGLFTAVLNKDVADILYGDTAQRPDYRTDNTNCSPS